MNEKNREQKLKRDAEKKGMQATKGKNSYGVEGWMIVDSNTNAAIGGCYPTAYSFTLEEAEAFVAELTGKNYAAPIWGGLTLKNIK